MFRALALSLIHAASVSSGVSSGRSDRYDMSPENTKDVEGCAGWLLRSVAAAGAAGATGGGCCTADAAGATGGGCCTAGAGTRTAAGGCTAGCTAACGCWTMGCSCGGGLSTCCGGCCGTSPNCGCCAARIRADPEVDVSISHGFGASVWTSKKVTPMMRPIKNTHPANSAKPNNFTPEQHT